MGIGAEEELSHTPQEMRGHGRSDDRSTVTNEVHELIQVFDLEPVVEGVAKAMGPVNEQKRTEDEEEKARERVSEEFQEMLVAGRREPSQGERNSEEQEEDGCQQSRQDTPGAEEQPQERLVRTPGHSIPEKEPGHRRRRQRPEQVIGGDNPGSGEAPPSYMHHHRLGRQAEPGDGVEDDERQARQIQEQDGRARRPAQELSIGVIPSAHRMNEQEKKGHGPDDENATQLAQDKGEIGHASQPPVGGFPVSQPARMVLGVAGAGSHGTPQGIKSLLSDASDALSL